MRSLKTYDIEDWAEFIQKHDIDLTCSTCSGTGTVTGKKKCEECDGTGKVECDECDGKGKDEDGDECIYCNGTGKMECSDCDGTGEVEDDEECCEDCNGSGYIEPMWNTIWNTGFHAVAGRKVPRQLGTVFAFEWDNEIWFGLSGCGMDCGPYLAAAWMEMFPDCEWLPEQFITEGCNLRGGYVESLLGKKEAKRVYALIANTIKGERRSLAFLAEDLKVARQRMSEKAKQ